MLIAGALLSLAYVLALAVLSVYICREEPRLLQGYRGPQSDAFANLKRRSSFG